VESRVPRVGFATRDSWGARVAEPTRGTRADLPSPLIGRVRDALRRGSGGAHSPSTIASTRSRDEPIDSMRMPKFSATFTA